MPSQSKCVVSALACAVMLAACASLAHAQEEANEQYRIEGGWLFTVNVPPNTPGPASYPAVEAFAAGGAWSGSASADTLFHFSPGYGTWKRVDDTILVTQFQFAQDLSGVPTGRVIVHAALHFTSPEHLAGKSSITFCNLNGGNCFTPPADAAVAGVKIAADGPVH